MGLDTSHDAWHGSYSSFARWRAQVAKAAGMPPLCLMDGFYVPMGSTYETFHQPVGHYVGKLKELDGSLPIQWDALKPSALHILLRHSDCDGEIPWDQCMAIAVALTEILPAMGKWEYELPGFRGATLRFIEGLTAAATAHEPLLFH